jgi:hypothetical protein
MKRSDSIQKITEALITFQKQVTPIIKTRTATERGREYKYASLSDVQEAINQPLTDNGLNIVQMPDGAGLTTILSHTSGEWFESYYELPMKNTTPQGLGSSITYLRRYAIAAMLNLCLDDDDDGAVGAEPAQTVPISVDGKIDIQAVAGKVAARRVRKAPAKKSKPIDML